MGNLTTSLIQRQPLRCGMTERLHSMIERGTGGDASALLELTKEALAVEAAVGPALALALAEVPAMMAAVCGGEEAKRVFANILERQAALHAEGASNLGYSQHRMALWQAASIYEELGDGSEVERVLALLAAHGDSDAAVALRAAA